MREICHCVFHLAITGEAEGGRKGEALLGLCQTVVEGVPGDPSDKSDQAGQDFCTGLSIVLTPPPRAFHHFIGWFVFLKGSICAHSINIKTSSPNISCHLLGLSFPLGVCLHTLQDENGVNRPVCSYVRVLRAGRLLESPRQAARFVSLLAHEKAPVVGGGGKQEQWCTLMAFLCRGKVRRGSRPLGSLRVGMIYFPRQCILSTVRSLIVTDQNNGG